MYDFSSFPVIRLIKKLHPFFNKKKKKNEHIHIPKVKSF